MSPTVDPTAGRLPDPARLADIPGLVKAYYEQQPDAGIREQRVAFGTSGHRGSSLNCSFTERHILAVTQAICLYRRDQGIDGPLFMGFDTHALSHPAFMTALEVLAANGVRVMIAPDDGYTPTPAISHAIIAFNRDRQAGLADGIVITPSHNPPEDGGFKYNPPHGGPAGTAVTSWIEGKANEILADLGQVKRIPYEQAQRSSTVELHDFVAGYVGDLFAVLDMDAIRGSGLRLGADALGGAGLQYWSRIAELYGLDITVLNAAADPTFRFMTCDWDGKIRMDPSSPHAMQSLIGMKDRFDLSFACDTDHDRHGIVTRSAGLMPSNHYLAVCADYLSSHRPEWKADAAVGKTIVSSGIIDRVAARVGRTVYETPVGFKWFVNGLCNGSLGFVGEESAGSTFLRRDGQAWTTDKDGIAAALLSAEITATTGRDPSQVYGGLTAEVGESFYRRSDAPASRALREALGRVTAETAGLSELAGEPVTRILTHAPGNGNAIGGIKIETEDWWFAVRPSGTEDVYKIYAESFRDAAHLTRIEEDAGRFVDRLLTA